jgi:hypothetical protein
MIEVRKYRPGNTAPGRLFLVYCRSFQMYAVTALVASHIAFESIPSSRTNRTLSIEALSRHCAEMAYGIENTISGARERTSLAWEDGKNATTVATDRHSPL